MFSTQTIQNSFSNFLSAFVRTSTTAQPEAVAPARSQRRHSLTISLRQPEKSMA